MKIGMSKILVGWVLVVLAACSAPPTPQKDIATGVGLSAEYFFGGEFKGPAFTQVSSKVSFNWGQIAPVLGMRPGSFSARFSGFIQPEFSEEYTFFVPANGEARLWIDGQLVSSGGRVKLQAGKRHVIHLEFRKTAHVAALGLEWGSPSTKQAVVPQNRLYPAQQTNKVQALAVPEGQNLLLNGDFEQDTGGWLTAAGEANPLSPGRSGGGKAVSVEDLGWLQQDLPFSLIEPGKTYTFEIWGKSVSGQVCSTGIGGGTSDGKGFQQRLEFTGDWEKKTLNFTLPANSSWLAVFLTSSNTDCYYDDVSLQIGTAPPPPPTSGPNLVTNGGFESSTNGWAVFGGSNVVGSGHQGNAVQGETGTWIQQNLDFSKLAIGQTYVLRAWSRPVSAADSSGSCTVGFSAGTPDQVLITRTLNFRNAQATWEEKALSETIPTGTTWAAVYLAANSPCQFDDIGLASVNSPNLSDLNPANLALGAILSNSAQGSVQFSNNGVAPLIYSTKLEKGTAFSITSGASGSIKTAETAQVGISVSCSTAVETRTDTLMISSNDLDEPIKQVPLSLECLKPVALSPAFQRERAWGIVQNVGWSPDGKRLFTHGNQSPLTLWDSASGRQLSMITTTQFFSETAAVWNPAGDKIATASGNGVQVWDAYTGELVSQPGSFFFGVRSLDFSPDGRKIAVAQNSSIAVLDVYTLQSSLNVNTQGTLQSIRWSPDGSMLATSATSNDSIILWNASTGAELRRINGRASDAIAWSPDSKQIASLRGIWNVEDGSLIRELEANTSSYGAIDWSADGKLIAGMVYIFGNTQQSYSAEVRVWNLQSNTSVSLDSMTIAQYQQYADIAFSPDSSKVFASGLRGKPAVYDLTNQTLVLDLGLNAGQIGFSPDKNQLGLTLNNRFQTWDANTGELRLESRQGSGNFAFSPDGSKLALNYFPDAGLNGLRVLNIANNSALFSSRIRADQLSWNPGGTQLLVRNSESFSNFLQILDASTGDTVANLERGFFNSFISTAWSSDGKAVMGIDTNNIYTWDSSTGKLIKTTPYPGLSSSGEARALRWSPDAGAVAMAFRNFFNQDSSTRIISATGQRLATLPFANAVAWSPDGKKIALSPFNPSSNYSDTFTIYEVKSGFPIITVKAAGAITQLEWSQNGDHIAALYTQGDITALTVWSVNQ